MHGNDEATSVVFRDLLFLVLSGFTIAMVLMFASVNPKAKKADADASVSGPGSVMVEAVWGSDVDADVDLWVRGPDGQAVGYSNKGGAVFNLMRDDLGNRLDASGLNYESSHSRGVLPGKYTVNLHLYRNNSKVAKLPVKVVVSVKPTAKDGMRQLLATNMDLLFEGDEVTAFNFALSEGGNVVRNSVNTLRTPLRDLKGK